MNKKIIFFIALTISGFVNAQEQYGKISFNKAVNISGKQRMLSQKMSKAYIYLLENPNNDDVKNELTTSKVIFEKHNDILKKYSVSKATTNKIKEVDEIWNKMRIIFEGTPNITDGKKIVQANSLLLNRANDVVKSIILDSEANSQVLSDNIIEENIDLKNIINTSGKQRMYAQRLALYYFANIANLKSESVTKNLENTYNNFDNAIEELLISDFNDDKIEATLGQAMKDWNEFKSNKKDFLNHKMSSEEVFKKTNNLTSNFNKLTILYEKLNVN